MPNEWSQMLMLHGNPTFLLIVVVVARKKDIDCVVNAAVLSLERGAN